MKQHSKAALLKALVGQPNALPRMELIYSLWLRSELFYSDGNPWSMLR